MADAGIAECDCGPVVERPRDEQAPPGREVWAQEKSSGNSRAGVLVFDAVGRLLLQQSYGNKWGVAKGAVRDLLPSCESPRQAAVRELAEETGLDRRAEDLAPLGVIGICHTRYHFYHLRERMRSETSLRDPECTALAWVCPRCFRQKLRDRRGSCGLDAVNMASRLLLQKVLAEGVICEICRQWAETPALCQSEPLVAFALGGCEPKAHL